MNTTITVSPETATNLEKLAAARGITIEALVAELTEDAMNKPLGRAMTGEEFMQYLEQIDKESIQQGR